VLVVGLTGGIGAGKSTVAALLAERGACVVDVDALGRSVLAVGGAATAAVSARFGPGVVAADGGIDRAALAAHVFDDPAALRDLTAISHPAINVLLAECIAGAGPDDVVVLDMAVLVESALGQGPNGPVYDVVVVVEAPWTLRCARLAARGIPVEEAERRRAAQASDDQRREVADFVVVNDDDLEGLSQQVDLLWDELRARASKAPLG
jgi:dephospho-CoA kinase